MGKPKRNEDGKGEKRQRLPLTNFKKKHFMNILLVGAMISVSQKFQRTGENKCLNTLLLRLQSLKSDIKQSASIVSFKVAP